MKSSQFNKLFETDLLNREHDLIFSDIDISRTNTVDQQLFYFIKRYLYLISSIHCCSTAFLQLKDFPEADSCLSYSIEVNYFINRKDYSNLNLNPVIYYGVESYNELNALKINFLLGSSRPYCNKECYEKYRKILNEHRIAINNFKRSVEKNISSTKNYFNKLIAHSPISVIRVFLFFNSDEVNSLERIKQLLPEFLKEVRKESLGYLWMIEPRAPSYSVHFMLIQRLCEENSNIIACMAIADQLGKQWVALGNQGELGYFFYHDHYIDPSPEKPFELERLNYLTESILKYGYFFNVKGSFRLLGRGEIPRSKPSKPAPKSKKNPVPKRLK